MQDEAWVDVLSVIVCAVFEMIPTMAPRMSATPIATLCRCSPEVRFDTQDLFE